ncbi:TPA: polysaccharide deacetylase family protein [Campylobacter coli]|nr:polysaccharide deacetylase family protein [Campylobacter coli]
MKVIMYHYVRKGTNELPYFRYLSFENFCKQLVFFKNNFDFVQYEDFIKLKQDLNIFNKIKGKILLSFDDGLKDHYRFVFPKLLEYKIFGLFFIPTQILSKKKALDVHRIHYLLGKIGGGQLTKFTLNLIDSNALEKDKKQLFKDYYKELDDDLQTRHFKLLFNFYIKYDLREKILDELVKYFCSDEEIYENLYLNFQELKDMHESNMIIGSHSHTHPNFLKISKEQEEIELLRSFKELENFSQKIKIFSYPYGDFTPYSETLLSKLNCDMAFTSIANSRDIEKKNLKENFYTLPRYDCNIFPFGKASKG